MQTATCSEARTQALHPLEQWGVRPEAKAPRVFGLRDDNTEKWVHGDERAEKPNRGQGADPDVSTRQHPQEAATAPSQEEQREKAVVLQPRGWRQKQGATQRELEPWGSCRGLPGMRGWGVPPASHRLLPLAEPSNWLLRGHLPLPHTPQSRGRASNGPGGEAGPDQHS